MDRICVTCKIPKEEKEFDWRNTSKGTRVSRCKPCQRAYGKNWYQKNKVKHKGLTNLSRARAREKINKLKSQPCTDCGKSYPPYVMDFDHTENNKVDNIANLFHTGRYTLAYEEIKKCEVVCSNCHRERTNKRSGRQIASHSAVYRKIVGSIPMHSANK